MVDGRLAGTWTRAVTAHAVDIDVAASRGVTSATREAIEAEAHRFGHFLGREPRLAIET